MYKEGATRVATRPQIITLAANAIVANVPDNYFEKNSLSREKDRMRARQKNICHRF
tara:strand:- start:734 stop:901 length:168 start_codon:yes stop_codon:yes gene_type:complete